jgi:hypothetical protein
MDKKLKKLFPLCTNKVQITKNGTRMVTVPKQWASVNEVKEIRWFWDMKKNWLILVPLEKAEQELI